MKKMIFMLVSVILLATQPVFAQSSWYNPNHRNTSNQNSQSYSSWYNPNGQNATNQNTNQGNGAPMISYKNYEYTFSDGTHFKGYAELRYGEVSVYKGSMSYPNGDMVVGEWSASWSPVSNHDYYRASDHTHWSYYYDSYGNRQNYHQVFGGSEMPSPSASSNGKTPCGVCNHSGTCRTCNGTGISPNHAPGIVAACGACGGSGKCATCRGLGYY